MGKANEGTGAPHTTARGFAVMIIRRGAEEVEVNVPVSIALGQAVRWESRGVVESADPAVRQVFAQIIDAWFGPRWAD